MKSHKYILITVDGDDRIAKKYYSMKHIAFDLKLEYYVVRQIAKATKTKPRFLHHSMKLLTNKYKILYLSPIDPNEQPE